MRRRSSEQVSPDPSEHILRVPRNFKISIQTSKHILHVFELYNYSSRSAPEYHLTVKQSSLLYAENAAFQRPANPEAKIALATMLKGTRCHIAHRKNTLRHWGLPNRTKQKTLNVRGRQTASWARFGAASRSLSIISFSVRYLDCSNLSICFATKQAIQRNVFFGCKSVKII